MNGTLIVYRWKITFLGDNGTKVTVRVDSHRNFASVVESAWIELDHAVSIESTEIFDIVYAKRMGVIREIKL